MNRNPLVLVCIALLLLVSSLPAVRAADGARHGVSPQGVIPVRGGHILVRFEGRDLRLARREVFRWVRRAANAVISYYGSHNIDRTTIVIKGTPGSGVGYATATSDDDGHGLIEVPLGEHTGVDDLDKDWVLTHEMVHLNFPLVTGNRGWISEGVATYVEPISRLQAGELTPERVWGELVRDMPQGLPEQGDRGLDYTPTWGRKYWGGAMFMLLADIEIRARTNNRKGLQDALQAIANNGGHIGSDWSVERAFAVGDRAVGVSVLQSLYKNMRARPVSVNLKSIWLALGIHKRDGSIVFNDLAPLAHIRHAISNGAPTPLSAYHADLSPFRSLVTTATE